MSHLKYVRFHSQHIETLPQARVRIARIKIEPEHCDVCGQALKPTDRVFRRNAGKKRVVHVECEGTE